MQVQNNSVLKINDYELFIYLGVDKSERENKQRVLLSIEIYFTTLPKASITDNVKDTICYHSICSGLENFNDKTFSTIEALAHKIFIFLDNNTRSNCFKLQINKFPHIKNLKGGISFSIDNQNKLLK